MREAGKFPTALQNNPPWTLQRDLTAGRGLRGAKFTSGNGCSLPASLQRFWGRGVHMGQIWGEQDFLGDLTRIFDRGSVVFVWGGAAGGGSISFCPRFIASIGGICVLGVGLGIKLWFNEILRFS